MTPLFPAAFSQGGVRYSATGHILYCERSRIVARRFDVSTREVGAELFTLVDAGALVTNVRFAIGGHTLAYAASNAGTRILALADRQGTRRPLANLPAGLYEAPSVSPRGDRIAVLRTNPNDNLRDVWVYDLSSARLSPVTQSGGIGSIAWSADGLRVAYTRGTMLFWRRFDASDDEALILRNSRRFGRISLTSEKIVFQEGPSAWDVGVATIGTPQSDSLILHGEYWEGAPAVSPDGRWLAYYSAEGGKAQIFVQPFLRPGRKVQVSPIVGINASWSADSRRLFWSQGDQLMEATLSFDADVAVQSVRALFDLSGSSTGTPMVDVFPDGNRFAVTELQGATAANAITVVSNFSQLLTAGGRK